MSDQIDRTLEGFTRLLEDHSKNAKSQMDAFQDAWRQQDQRASDSRRLLYSEFQKLGEKFNEIGVKVNSLELKVDAVAKDVERIKPDVDGWKARENQAIGGAAVVKLVWIIGSAVVIGIISMVGFLAHYMTLHFR